MLISEYAGSSRFQPLSWNLRMKIALGAAKGLAFLHSDKAKVIYRDFKTSNVLLDAVCNIQVLSFWTNRIAQLVELTAINFLQNYNAKLSDFGLAKDGPTGDKSHVSTRVMGTHGYAAPEYLATGTAVVPVPRSSHRTSIRSHDHTQMVEIVLLKFKQIYLKHNCIVTCEDCRNNFAVPCHTLFTVILLPLPMESQCQS